MKVYVVFSGEYDEWDVEGVYSSIDLAKEANRICGDRNEIREIDLNSIPDHPDGHFPFAVTMDETGKIYEIDTQSMNAINSFPWGAYSGGEYRVLTRSRFYVFNVWALDEKHAACVAINRRADLIASGIEF